MKGHYPRCDKGLRYKDGCRCDFCRAVAVRAQQDYRLREAQRNFGVQFPQDLVSPGDAILAIKTALHDWGLTVVEVSRLTGIPKDNISKILHGKRTRITRRVSEAICRGLADDESRAITLTTRVPVNWSRQMVKSLAAQGWTFGHQRDILYNNLGVNAGFIQSVCMSTNTNCYAGNEAHIKWLVRAIGDASGPSARSMTIMKNRGVFPTKHYNLKGDLIVSTLSPQQKQFIKRV